MLEHNVVSPWLTEAVAAQYLGVSRHTMRMWRRHQRGPRFAFAGKKVVYHQSWLDDFVMATATPEAVAA